MDFDNSDSPCRFFTSLVRELKSLAISNIEYFKDGKLSHHAKFHVAFCMLFEYLDLGIEPCYREISQRVTEFDASQTEKGNGYRSLLRIVQKCCLHLLQITRHISTNRESMLFRRAFYMKELEAYVTTLGQLRACLYYAQKLMNYCQAGHLFADEETLDDALAEQLMTDVEMLSSDCFYGRCLGFQFCESMQRPLHMVAIAMASFGEGYQEHSQIMKVATSLFNSGKYIMNPDLRAKQVVNITRTADIQFCKAFWSITESEIMHQLPSMVCPAVQVDEVFHLGPDAFDMPSADGSEEITITPPCAHTGPAPVQVRLISYQVREGQDQRLKSPVAAKSPRSPGLVVHCHGGGFVAQSSRSHEVYLRDWAKDLDVPILSIDYSLAPESPFPRALEECFYAYAWAVHNCEQLGSTGERIVLAGDSAGGNLIVATAMRAASFDIRRPDGLLGVYTPVLVRYTPSPARLLALMDPLLPAGILSRCLAAYAGVSDELSSQLAASVTCHIESSAATLRMSAQESQEPDWVVVSQDAAAKTSGTLASPQASSPDKLVEENGEEVEIFSRPKSTAISSLVSDATGKLVSYMGSYTDRLTKSFTMTRQTPAEEIPLVPVDGQEQRGVGASDAADNLYGSSIDDSPCTPSFHTPMTTPSQAKALPGADLTHSQEEKSPQAAHSACDQHTMHSSPASAENTVQTSSNPSLGYPQCLHENTVESSGNNGVFLSPYTPQKSGGGAVLPEFFEVGKAKEGATQLQTSPVNTHGLLEKNKSGEEMVEILTGDGHTPSPQDLMTEGTVSDGATSEGDRVAATAQDLALSDQPSPAAGEDRGEHAAVCDDPEAFSIEEAETEGKGLEGVEPQIFMPSLEPDKAELLQIELDSSAASNTPSTTLPSSLLSTPSDDLNSFDILGSEQSSTKQTSASPTIGMEGGRKLNDFLSPTYESQPLENNSHSREQAVEVMDTSGTGTDQGLQNDHSDGANVSHTEERKSSNDIAAVETHGHHKDVALESAASSSVDLACPHPFIDPLLSPDSGCLSDEADKMVSSGTSSETVTSAHSDTAPGLTLSREKLRLDLCKAASDFSFPRSMSQPSLSSLAGSRSSHSMSPSDFKRERHLAQSPLRAIRNIPMVKNPYMSPLLAPDWLLEGLPHVCLVACHLDPLLDDSVMFTRRLRSLGKTVDLLLIDDLPHGFLNFSLASRDAKHASDQCVRKLQQLLCLEQGQRQ